MRRFLILLLLLSFRVYSVEIGAGLNIDYYNNPVEGSAPVNTQNRPVLFYNLSLSVLNIRSGVGVVTAQYKIDKDTGIPVFNNIYTGFYTIEADIFVTPGVLFDLTEDFSLGLAGGIGARLPILTEIDDSHSNDLERINWDMATEALKWFYEDNRFLYWSGEIFTYITLPMDSKVRFYGSVNYKSFFTRDDQWTLGATVGVLWLLN